MAKYLDWVYSPERVLYPMRRVRPKGHEDLQGAYGHYYLQMSDAAIEPRVPVKRRRVSRFGRAQWDLTMNAFVNLWIR